MLGGEKEKFQNKNWDQGCERVRKWSQSANCLASHRDIKRNPISSPSIQDGTGSFTAASAKMEAPYNRNEVEDPAQKRKILLTNWIPSQLFCQEIPSCKHRLFSTMNYVPLLYAPCGPPLLARLLAWTLALAPLFLFLSLSWALSSYKIWQGFIIYAIQSTWYSLC
jgi:hypothetical protein